MKLRYQITILISIILSLSLMLSFCSGKTADTVVIVKGKWAKFYTNETINEDFDYLDPGNIIVFREDGTFSGSSGKAGMAYKIIDIEHNKLEPIGEVDLNLSDEELARQFGVNVKHKKSNNRILNITEFT